MPKFQINEEFQQLTPHIYRMNLPFKIPLISAIPVSVFLVQDTKSSDYYLIDAGPVGVEDQIIKALAKFFDKEVGCEKPANILKEIKGVLLTHYHVDHCGSLRALYEISGEELKMSTHPDEIDYYGMEKPSFDNVKSENWMFSLSRKILGHPKLGLKTQSLDLLMDSYFRNGEKCQEKNDETSVRDSNSKPCSLRCCHCPGHTPGHCSFFHEEDRAMVGSDMILNMSGCLEFSPKLSSPNLVQSIQGTKNLVNTIKDQVDFIFPSHDISENGLKIGQVVEFVNK